MIFCLHLNIVPPYYFNSGLPLLSWYIFLHSLLLHPQKKPYFPFSRRRVPDWQAGHFILLVSISGFPLLSGNVLRQSALLHAQKRPYFPFSCRNLPVLQIGQGAEWSSKSGFPFLSGNVVLQSGYPEHPQKNPFLPFLRNRIFPHFGHLTSSLDGSIWINFASLTQCWIDSSFVLKNPW